MNEGKFKNEQQPPNVEMEEKEKTIEISEKGDNRMKWSIIFLKIGFWTILILLSGSIIYELNNMLKWYRYSPNGSMLSLQLIIWVLFVILLIKMNSYIGSYKKFKKNKTKQTLEGFLDTQRGYYGLIYLLPIILIGIYLIAIWHFRI